MPEGNVDGDHRVSPGIGGRPRSPKSGPVRGIDHEVGEGKTLRQCGRVEHGDAHALAFELARRGPTIVAVVALAGDDRDPPAVRSAEEGERGAGHGGPRALDQHFGAHVGPGIDGGHLRRRDDRDHALTVRDQSAMAMACAVRSVCVIDSRHSRMPLASARRAAFPVRRTAGAPDDARTTSTSR